MNLIVFKSLLIFFLISKSTSTSSLSKRNVDKPDYLTLYTLSLNMSTRIKAYAFILASELTYLDSRVLGLFAVG